LVAEPRSGACQVPVTFISIRHQIHDPEWPFLAIAIEAHFDWCHGSSVLYEKSNLLNAASDPVAIAARKTVTGPRDLLLAIRTRASGEWPQCPPLGTHIAYLNHERAVH